MEQKTPKTWAEFFELTDLASIPQDFMSEADRSQGEQTRDPFGDGSVSRGEHQTLYESLVEEYRAMFANMDDAARASWFFAMDESVILSFDVGKNESIMQAEERHAVKLEAIATALSGLPCATKEQHTIKDLQKMASMVHKRHDALTASENIMRLVEGMEKPANFDHLRQAIIDGRMTFDEAIRAVVAQARKS